VLPRLSYVSDADRAARHGIAGAGDGDVTEETQWSVTRTEYWLACRYAYWLRYLAKVPASQPPSRARVHGRLVHVGLAAALEAARREPGTAGQMMIGFRALAHAAIMAYTGRGEQITNRSREDAWAEVAAVLETMPVPGRGAIVAIERQFSITPGEFTIGGVIDYAARTGRDSAHLRDWKTGSIPENPEELQRNIQLLLYALAVAHWFDWVRRLTVGLYSTRTGREVITTVGNNMITWAVGRIETIAAEERSVGQLVQQGEMSITSAYPVTKGMHCATCDFRSYCPLFAKADLPVVNAEQVEESKRRVARLLT
jgi:RecB family exonuclease